MQAFVPDGVARFGLALLAVAALAIGMAVHAAPAEAAPDRVRGAIVRAAATGKITGEQRREFLKTWSWSRSVERRLRRAGQTSRANEVAASRGIASAMASRGQLTAQRLEAVMANVRATAWVFQHRGLPAARSRHTVPFDEVVFGYYPGSGLQVQPLFTFAKANTLHLTFQHDQMEATLDRMEELAVRRSGYLTWEYYFPFGGAQPTWTSAMAQAVALDAYSRAWDRTGNEDYLVTAQQLLPGLERTTRAGGLSTPESGGRWFLLYAFLPSQRVLNGHLQVMVSLNNYWERTEDPRARRLIVQGLRAVRPNLRRFDTGAWSNYQPGQEADVGYHDLATYQLSKLGRKLREPTLANYAHRFAGYRSTPPRIVVPRQPIRAMYPVPRDGFRDRSALRYMVDKQSRMVFEVLNRHGEVMRSWTEHVDRGGHTMAWDGSNSAGKPVPPGAYTLRLTATDVIGNRRSGEVTDALVVARDTTAPQVELVALQDAAAGSRIIIRATDAHSSGMTVVLRGPAGRTVTSTTMRNGRTVLRVPVARWRLAGGSVRITDSSGNGRTIRLR